MDTQLATSSNEQSLILPNKREALLIKLNEFKVDNLSARDLEDYNILTSKINHLFKLLCWSKLGISYEQLKKLNQQELNELAVVIYERSRIFALVQAGILACIPVVGWIILSVILGDPGAMPPDEDSIYRNLRYYSWCRRMKDKYGRIFEPTTIKTGK